MVASLLGPAASAAVEIGPGDLVAVDTVSGNVVLVDPGTGAQTLISAGGGGEDVVVDDTGRIFLVRNNDVVEVDPATGVQTFVAENVVGSSVTLFGLDLTAAGDLVVSPYSLSPLLVDVDTGATTTIAGVTGSRFGPRVEETTGDLFFVQEVTDEVRRYSATGTFIQSYPLLGVPPNPFGRPGSLSFAPNGDLVVTDRNEAVFVRVDIGTGALDPLGPVAFAAMSAHFDVDAAGDYIIPAIELGLPVGIYRVDPTTGAETQITTGGFLSTGGGLTSVVVAPATLPQPPGTTPAFEPCPGNGSVLTDPLILCQSAFGVNGPSFDSEAGFPSFIGLVNDSNSNAGTEASGSTNVGSQLGYAEFDVVADKLGTTDAGDADVSAGVHWQDTVTLDATGFTGNAGRFRGVFLVTFAPNNTATLGSGSAVLSQAAWAVDVETDGFAGGQYSGRAGVADSLASGLEDLAGGVNAGVLVTNFQDFVFGTPFTLDVDARVRLLASGDATDATASSDAAAKVVWFGMTDIQSVGSVITPVPDVWVSSTSTEGLDWRTPVGLPEPGIGATLIAGCFALSAFVRGRGVRGRGARGRGARGRGARGRGARSRGADRRGARG